MKGEKYVYIHKNVFYNSDGFVFYYSLIRGGLCLRYGDR